jgi:hypothetical protein
MADYYGITLEKLRQRMQLSMLCAYCRQPMREYPGVPGCRADQVTIEHLNRHGPIHTSQGLRDEHWVLACCACNSRRGDKRLCDWFLEPYCLKMGINENTVAELVRRYLQTDAAGR